MRARPPADQDLHIAPVRRRGRGERVDERGPPHHALAVAAGGVDRVSVGREEVHHR